MFQVLALCQSECTLNQYFTVVEVICDLQCLAMLTSISQREHHLGHPASFVFLTMIMTITVFNAPQCYHCHYQCSSYHHYRIVIPKVVVVVINKMEIANLTQNSL